MRLELGGQLDPGVVRARTDTVGAITTMRSERGCRLAGFRELYAKTPEEDAEERQQSRE